MIKKIISYKNALFLCTLACASFACAKINLNIDLDEADFKNKLARAAEKKEVKTRKKKLHKPQKAETKKRRSQQRSKKSKKKAPKKPKIKFNFKNTPLVKIINKIAAKKGINVVLPQGPNAIKNTVTFEQKKKITLEQAEEYMYTFLQLAGYAMHPQNGFFVISKQTNTNATREPLHLYINLPPDNLPQGEERIRAIYYLSNFKVPQTTQGNEPLNLILKDMLGTKKGYLFDPHSNAVILTGSSNKIASVMTIILELDNAGSPEIIEIFQLYNSTASTVAKLLNEQILASKKNVKVGSRSVKGSTGKYFSNNTRVVADTQTNSLILLGTEASVNRIKDFVREYMDLAPEEGESILHVYDLQYLNSKEFAGVLQKIIKNSVTGQSKKGAGGPQRLFEDVVVVAEEEQEVKAKNASGGSSIIKGAKGRVTVGGNRLVIAARREDYKQIKQLIEQLDRPELQVIVEVMVLDVNLEGDKLLQAQTRNPKLLDLHENIEFQTAHVQEILLDADTPTTLAPDLLRLLGGNSMAIPETTGSGVGSMIISLKDSCNVTGNNGASQGIWSVLKILDRWVERKVISHPFIVTKNNVKAREALTDIRRASGGLQDTSKSVATTTLQQDFKAVLGIEVTPRISSLDRLNMQIKIEIEDFVGETGFNRTTRSIETNANLGSGEILVLGGLTKTTDGETETKMPILGSIPIVGSLFRGTAKTKRKNNLVVFIHPTVVDPKLRAGQRLHTDHKIEQQYSALAEGELFSQQKDPITRFFFKDDASKDATDAMTQYLEESHYQEAFTKSSYQPIDHDVTGASHNGKLKNLLNNMNNPFDKKKAK